MAVRIRSDNKTIICAAKSLFEPGDVYIDDNMHYVLSTELVVLSVYGVTPEGADLWKFHAPITLRERIDNEEKAKVNIIRGIK